MTRCRSYLRARGVFRYRGVRCTLALGHSGRHTAPGRFLDPRASHTWGVDRAPEPVDALTADECDAIGADGRDGRGWIMPANLTEPERAALAAYRAHPGATCRIGPVGGHSARLWCRTHATYATAAQERADYIERMPR